MKKFLSIIYTAVFLAACALALVACDVVAEADVDRLMRKCNSHEEIQLVDAAAFTDVFIQTDVYSVYVTESDFRDIITLDYAEEPDFAVSYTTSYSSVSGECVNFSEKPLISNAQADNCFMIVGLPERMMEQGLISLTVLTETGNVQIDDVTAQELFVRTDTGTIRLDDCHAEDTQLTASVGSIYAEAAGKSVSIDTNIGSVEFDIDAKDIRITTDTGAIRGTVDHPEYWYTIDAHTDTGRNNLVNRTGNGEYKLTVRAVTGEIKVRFDND